MDKGTLAQYIYILYATIESIFGLIIYICSFTLIRFNETPIVTLCSPLQASLIKRCSCLKSFSPSPWAIFSHAQTVWGLLKQCGTDHYKRRDIVEAPDGVQLILDWKEGPNVPDDAPILFILHGIGGSSDSRLARLLGDAAAEQGWRAAVYNRRGHGESTLLPGPLVPVATTPAKRSSFMCLPVDANHVAASLAASAAAAATAAAHAASNAANAAAHAAHAAAQAATDTASNIRRALAGRDTHTSASPASAPASSVHPAQQPAVLPDASDESDASPSPPADHHIPDAPAAAVPASVVPSGIATPADLQPAAGTDQVACCEPKPRKQALRKVRVFPKHSDTDDMAAVAAHLAAEYPKAPKIALGFSQGSNVLVHYLGIHAKDPPPFTAGISVSNAYDLVEGTKLLQKDWVTDALIAKPIKQVLIKELPAVKELCAARSLQIDLDAALNAQGIRAFDAALVVPAYGYASVDDYYSHQASKDVLKDIRTPLLLLNNRDDPIIPPNMPDIAQKAATANPALVHVCTQRGGHLGWLHGWSGSPWIVQLMIEYTRAVCGAVKAGELHVHGEDMAGQIRSRACSLTPRAAQLNAVATSIASGADVGAAAAAAQVGQLAQACSMDESRLGVGKVEAGAGAEIEAQAGGSSQVAESDKPRDHTSIDISVTAGGGGGAGEQVGAGHT